MFSLFGRKDKTDARRWRDDVAARITPTTQRGPATGTSVETQRELARRTAAKIDQIESEMINAAPPTTRAAPATQPMPMAGRVPAPGMGAAALAGAPAATARPPAAALPPLEFSTSVVLGDPFAAAGGIQVGISALPPDLEEAAILYANGQVAAAAATLKAAIARGGLDAHARQAWLMLFDVLQAMGSRAEFEAVALDYAARFEKSPPPWNEATAAPAEARKTPTHAVVAFAGQLDAGAARQVDLVQRAGQNRRPVTADFSDVTEVEPQGALMVVRLISAFEKAGRELTVVGADRLLAAARSAIEPGRRDAADGGWQLALQALRLLGERQAFEDLSIDFCVTYEVSPPSWEPLAPCVRTTAPGTAAAAAAPKTSAVPAGPGAAQAGTQDTATPASLRNPAFALQGEIVGRAGSELNGLRAYAADRADVVVDARGLRRLDFVAAGELLNEVVTLTAAGKSVLLVEPSFIVDALLVVMGIHEVAEIRRRPA